MCQVYWIINIVQFLFIHIWYAYDDNDMHTDWDEAGYETNEECVKVCDPDIIRKRPNCFRCATVEPEWEIEDRVNTDGWEFDDGW